MKTFARVSAATILLASLVLACQKEAPAPTENSLIAFFDGNTATLFVTPDRESQVLDLYGAQLAGNNSSPSYFMTATAPDGTEVSMLFALRTATAGEIQEIADQAEQATEKPFKPESKVHANSECTKTTTKKPTACTQKKFDDGTAYHEKTTYEGKDGEITYAQCATTKGKSDCVEWKSIIGHTRQYVHNGCEGLPFAELPIYAFVCTK